MRTPAHTVADRTGEGVRARTREHVVSERQTPATLLQRRAGNRAVAQLLRPADTTAGEGDVPAGVRAVLSGGGQPLAPATRSLMEARFGRDFGEVRVHTDAAAEASACALHARAYTVGSHVVIPAPSAAPRRRAEGGLLAHELAHVVQQERGGATPALDPGAGHERAADSAAAAAVGGTARATVAGATGVGVARAPLTPGISDETPDLGEWTDRSPNVTDPVAWNDVKLLLRLGQIEAWLREERAPSSETDVATRAAADLRAEIDRRTARAAAAAEAAPFLPNEQAMTEQIDDIESSDADADHAESAPSPRPSSLSLLSPDEMCGGRCVTDAEIYGELDAVKARMAEEDREAVLRGKALMVTGALRDDENDRVIELFERTDPADRIAVQRKLDMETVIGSLSDFDAARLGTLGPVTAGQSTLNRKRASYIKQVIDDFAPVAPDRAEVLVLYALSGAHDQDAYEIFERLANERSITELRDMPNVARWMSARGLDASGFAEPSGSWTSIFPSMGRGIKRFFKDDRIGEYEWQKRRVPGEYRTILSRMEMDEYERNLSIKNTIIAMVDEVTFGVPHGLVDLARSTGSGIADIAQGEYEKGGEKLSGAAIVVLSHVAARTHRAVRSSINARGGQVALAIEADVRSTMGRLNDRFDAAQLERGAAMIRADSRAAVFVIENGEAGFAALLKADGNVKAAGSLLGPSAPASAPSSALADVAPPASRRVAGFGRDIEPPPAPPPADVAPPVSRRVAGFGRDIEPPPTVNPVPRDAPVVTQMPPARVVAPSPGSQGDVGSATTGARRNPPVEATAGRASGSDKADASSQGRVTTTQASKQDEGAGGGKAASSQAAKSPSAADSVWVQLEDGTIREYPPAAVRGPHVRGADVVTADGSGKVVNRAEPPHGADVRQPNVQPGGHPSATPYLITPKQLTDVVPQAKGARGPKQKLNAEERRNAEEIHEALRDVNRGNADAMNRVNGFRPHQHLSGEFAGWWSVDLRAGNPGALNRMRMYFRVGRNGLFEAKIRQFH